MEQLVAGGVNQAVIMCLAPRGPLYGSLADDPAFLSDDWWDIFLGACEDANQIGFKFWIYDQYGFSGANFQGQLVAAHPHWAGQELARVERIVEAGEAAEIQAPTGSVPLGAYFVAATGDLEQVPLRDGGSARWSGGAGRLCLCYAHDRGFDYFDAEACAALIDTVLGEFRRRADKWFGPVITGLFQDELPNMPTWGKSFAETFEADHGYDLLDRLACLWEGEDDPAAGRVRRDYHSHRAKLARLAFFEPYGAWARDAGLLAGFDQQTPAREGDPASATELYGDYLSTHAVYSAPGSDHWGDPKVHSSLAHANGHPRTWIEAFHSSGWGGTLEETYDWLGPFLRRGANLYDPHAVYYATVGGWWEWAPPSTCWRQPYWPDYRVFSDSVTRLCSLTSAGQLIADTVLVYPTDSVQSDVLLDGGRRRARRTSDVYHELNGSTSWFDERPGVLDRAHRDYEVLDERVLVDGALETGSWLAAGGSFRNVVLPAPTTMTGRFARMLARFASEGGNVVVVGDLPHHFVDPDQAGGQEFRAAVASGKVSVVPDAADLPAHLVSGPISVESDVPFMLRRYGDALVLLLVAHDERTGTRMPVFPGSGVEDRIAGTFTWRAYWESFSEKGYTFAPVGDRRARVRVEGAPARRAQRWDPRTGERVDLESEQTAYGDVLLDVPFTDGPISVVVLAGDLPDATRADPEGPARVEELRDDWELLACSTLDNRWADFGDPADRGTLPVQVWRFDHARAGTGAAQPPAEGWEPVLASFGPYLRVAGPCSDPPPEAGARAEWSPYEMSLSRGIRKDPLHFTSLGPKGTVPEEFIRWEGLRPGQWVAFGARLDLPEGSGRRLVLGADADSRVFIGGTESPVEGSGYWRATALPDGQRPVDLEVWLRKGDGRVGESGSEAASELRATFAVVSDLNRFRRPEWVEPEGGPRPGTTVRFTTTFDLEEVPPRPTIQVGSEGPCSIIVNGSEIGRQGAFEPYWARRRPQVMPYDLSACLRAGRNQIVLQVEDPGTGAAALLDSLPAAEGGLGLITGPEWSASMEGSDLPVRLRPEQWLDPRWVCLYARPHPLPRAAWLDPSSAGGDTVVDVVPDAWADGPRSEWLRMVAPVGTAALRVPTSLPFTALVEGNELTPAEGTVAFERALPAGTVVHLRFDARDGRRGGGLVDGPVEATVTAAPAPLADWESLGLRALGGYVAYRRAVETGPTTPGESVVLDLGAVRGSVEVRVNGELAATLVWSPYRADITAYLQPGTNQLEVVVRGTLAGYLDDASPTPAVYQGQARHGLFGPVRLLRYGPMTSQPTTPEREGDET